MLRARHQLLAMTRHCVCLASIVKALLGNLYHQAPDTNNANTQSTHTCMLLYVYEGGYEASSIVDDQQVHLPSDGVYVEMRPLKLQRSARGLQRAVPKDLNEAERGGTTDQHDQLEDAVVGAVCVEQ